MASVICDLITPDRSTRRPLPSAVIATGGVAWNVFQAAPRELPETRLYAAFMSGPGSSPDVLTQPPYSLT